MVNYSECFNGIQLTCGIEGGYIVSLRFGAFPDPDPAPSILWERARGELAEYFAGKRRTFDLPLKYAGTPFRRAVWEELLKIPYGATRTYGQIAAAIDRPKAFRAVGQACHVNPIVILIPCHRVLGADGALTGFAGGTDTKKTLLALEGLR